MALLSAGILCAQESLAQDHTRWGLPDGALARLGKGGIGWGDRAVAWSPDGTRLAVASVIGIWLYDAATGAEVALLSHPFRVWSVSFSPDGALLASSSSDGTILLWDMAPYFTPITVVEASSPSPPAPTALLANYPNPFNSRTRIAYRLAAPGPVRLEIYNALGQPVRTLVDEFQAVGVYKSPGTPGISGARAWRPVSIWFACTIRAGCRRAGCSTSSSPGQLKPDPVRGTNPRRSMADGYRRFQSRFPCRAGYS